jgi:PhzF family phenazine biosynthesis protein
LFPRSIADGADGGLLDGPALFANRRVARKFAAPSGPNMKIPYFKIAAFTGRAFAGNPAGVCLLEEWLPDGQLQAIAAENNRAETAFVVGRGGHFDLRWMTPKVEVDLCGHATIAAAHVLFHHRGFGESTLRFQTRSGELTVEKDEKKLVLDFPALPAEPGGPADEICAALGLPPREVLKQRDYLAVFATQKEVAAIQPDFARVAALDAQGLVVSAPGDDCDFVSRYFAPAVGIPEDPVTGSTHCTLIPYWSHRLGKKELFCRDRGDRVSIGGAAVTWVAGEIQLG